MARERDRQARDRALRSRLARFRELVVEALPALRVWGSRVAPDHAQARDANRGVPHCVAGWRRPLPADQDHARPVGPGPSGRASPRACRQPALARAVAAVQRAQEAHHHCERRGRPRARRLVLVASDARGACDSGGSPLAPGSIPSHKRNPPPRPVGRHHVDGSAWSDPRSSYEQPRTSVRQGHARPLDQRTLQPNSPSSGNQSAHISLTARRPDTHVDMVPADPLTTTSMRPAHATNSTLPP